MHRCSEHGVRVSLALLYCSEVPICLINRYVQPISSIAYKTNDRPVEEKCTDSTIFALAGHSRKSFVSRLLLCCFAVHCFSPLPSPCRRSRSIILIKPLLMRGKMARPRTEWDSVQYEQVILKLHMK